MPNRREVLQASVMLAAAGGVNGAFSRIARANSAESLLPLNRFVFDTRFADAYDAAQLLADQGVPESPFAGDLMELWYNELDQAWKQQPMTLAGMSALDSLFVLETLAQDHGMRVIYRGKHAIANDSKIEHTLSGPSAMLDAIQASMVSPQWSAAICHGLMQCPHGVTESSKRTVETTANGISLRDVPIFSWIIAPRDAGAIAEQV